MSYYSEKRKSRKEAKAKALALTSENKTKSKELNASLVDPHYEYIKQKMRVRANAEYPPNVENYKKERHRYYMLKNRRYVYYESDPSTRNEYKYNSPGREGYEWILSFCPTLKDFCQAPKMDGNSYNIQQYYAKRHAGKIIKNATCFDKIGAYVSWLLKPLPFCEEPCTNDINPEHSVSLYNYDNGASFDRKSTKIHSQYSLRRIPGIDAWYEDYKALLAKDKTRAKKLAVSAIGYMKRIGMLLPYYIWYMQGEEINQLRTKIEAAGNIVLKIHTDSITYLDNTPLDDDIIKYGYKCEFKKQRIYIVNAGCYHVESDNKPHGYNDPYNGNCVRYLDKSIPYTYFPCLVAGDIVYVNKNGQIQTRVLGEHNEI